MNSSRYFISAFAGAGLLIFGIGSRARQASHPEQAARKSVVVISQQLPPMSGEHLQAVLVEVTYPPGTASPVHSHPCPVVGYVTEGAIRFRVNDEPEKVFHAGDTFYEAPNGIHRVSANASQKEPAKLLAYFVCDGRKELTLPVKDTGK